LGDVVSQAVEGCGTFVRQAVNLWRIKPLLHEKLAGEWGRAANGPHHRRLLHRPCKLVRAVCNQVLKTDAAYGYCAAKYEYYFGLKAHLLIDRHRMMVWASSSPPPTSTSTMRPMMFGDLEAGPGRQELYSPAAQSGLRSAGHRLTNARRLASDPSVTRKAFGLAHTVAGSASATVASCSTWTACRPLNWKKLHIAL